MLFSVFLLLFTFVGFSLYGSDSLNVTLVPKPVQINLVDLPEPYATPYFDMSPTVIPVPSDPELSTPEGFSIKLYMSDLKNPRFLLYTPNGNILVSEPGENQILCLLDTDNDGFPDQRLVFADASNGLEAPQGMAFVGDFFYVGNRYQIRRYEWDPQTSRVLGNGTVIMTYPTSLYGHGTRLIVIPPLADQIYVTIGSNSDSDAEDAPYATVQRANIDGSNVQTFASGIRNPSGLTMHPITQEIYVTCNERNELGDDLVPDFFTRIQLDEFFGWPFAYLSPDLLDPTHTINGTSERPDLVARTKTPDILFPAHSAPLGIQFYTGKQFPDRYQNGAFVAIHGAAARKEIRGYSVVFIPFDSATNRPMGYYEDFVTGFLVDPRERIVFGRPVGLLVLKDGSLIFTDDTNNRIYQVQYNYQPHSYHLSSIVFLIISNFLFTFITL